MSKWVAVYCWSETRALKALTEARLNVWQPTTMVCEPLPKKKPKWSRAFFDEQRRQALQKPPQTPALFPAYMFCPAPENGYTAISEAEGVAGYLTSDGLGPRLIMLAELEPAILYVYAEALAHIRIPPKRRRKDKPAKGFGTLAQLLPEPLVTLAA